MRITRAHVAAEVVTIKNTPESLLLNLRRDERTWNYDTAEKGKRVGRSQKGKGNVVEGSKLNNVRLPNQVHLLIPLDWQRRFGRWDYSSVLRIEAALGHLRLST